MRDRRFREKFTALFCMTNFKWVEVRGHPDWKVSEGGTVKAGDQSARLEYANAKEGQYNLIFDDGTDTKTVYLMSLYLNRHPFSHYAKGLEFKAKRCDFVGGVEVHGEVYRNEQLASAVSEMIGYHATNIWQHLNGFSGYGGHGLFKFMPKE